MNEIWQLNQVNLSSVDKSNSVENLTNNLATRLR
jgi:hypothetical protein